MHVWAAGLNEKSHSMDDTLNLHPLFSENQVRGVVFDLDGTLIDSAADILTGMRMTLEQAGIGVLPDDYRLGNLYGTADNILRSIIQDMGWNGQQDYAALHQQYLKNAVAVNLQRTRLYEGVLDVLNQCRAAGLPLAICTNKAHAGAMAAVHKFHLADLFHFVTGSDTWEASKPSPLPLLKTIEKIGVPPEECIYFGDTSVDAECADAAGVPFVLHASGYCDEQVSSWPALHAFKEWKELLAGEEQAV